MSDSPGVAVGRFVPGIEGVLNAVTFHGTSLPIPRVTRTNRRKTGLTLAFNWLVALATKDRLFGSDANTAAREEVVG